jgi:hypothetical protein
MLERMEMSSLIKCIPEEWENHFFVKQNEDFEEQQFKLLKTRVVYRQKIAKIATAPTSETFFKTQFDVSDDNFSDVYGIPFISTIYTKLRAFQFKINHNIFYTNEKLYKIGYEDLPLYRMCDEKMETLKHLFFECEHLKAFWEKITNQLLKPFGVNSLSKENVIFGITPNDKLNNVVNHIILEAKYYIHVCRLEKNNPVFLRLKNRLKITENIERHIAFKNNKMKKHEYKWHHLINYLL